MKGMLEFDENNVRLPASEFHERREKCRKASKQKGLEGLIAFSRSTRGSGFGHVYYLTGHLVQSTCTTRPSSELYTSPPRGYAAVLVPVEKGAVLIGSASVYCRAAIDEYVTGFNWCELIASAIKKKGLDKAKIGLAGYHLLPISCYDMIKKFIPEVKFEPADDILYELRSIKSEKELSLLREAARLNDEVMEAGMESVEEGKRECDVAAVILHKMVELSTSQAACIVKTSSRMAMPGGKPRYTKKKIRRGDVIYIDQSFAYKGYFSDFSRNTVVGPPSDEQKDILNFSVELTEGAIDSLRPGIKAEDVYTIALNRMKERGYEKYELGEYVGHAMGTEVGEIPNLIKGDDTRIKENMVFAVEPGIYIPGFGEVRAEDDVIVTKNKPEVMTKCKRVWW